MNGVEITAKRKFNLRLAGVELNNGILGPGCGRQSQCGQPGEYREEEWNSESPKGIELFDRGYPGMREGCF
jgi:hypothetical protein